MAKAPGAITSKMKASLIAGNKIGVKGSARSGSAPKSVSKPLQKKFVAGKTHGM